MAVVRIVPVGVGGSRARASVGTGSSARKLDAGNFFVSVTNRPMRTLSWAIARHMRGTSPALQCC